MANRNRSFTHVVRVVCYQRIHGEQKNAFDRRLCDKYAVKRDPYEEEQSLDRDSVLTSDWQFAINAFQ
jgi:hypothetical protein